MMPARLAALLTAFCKLLSWMWWRRIAPLRGSWERLEAGKTYCQIHSRLAVGEVLLNLRSAHLSGVALIMEEDEALDPVELDRAISFPFLPSNWHCILRLFDVYYFHVQPCSSLIVLILLCPGKYVVPYGTIQRLHPTALRATRKDCWWSTTKGRPCGVQVFLRLPLGYAQGKLLRTGSYPGVHCW